MSERRSTAIRAIEDVRRRTVDVSALVVSALVAGAVFLLVTLVGHALMPKTTAWDAPLRIASLLVGADVQRSASTSRPGLFVIALLIHSMLSMTYALLIDLATLRMARRTAFIVGAGFGLGIYLVNEYAVAPLLPASLVDRSVVTLLAHVAFGVSAVAVFRWMKLRPGSAHEVGLAS